LQVNIASAHQFSVLNQVLQDLRRRDFRHVAIVVGAPRKASLRRGMETGIFCAR
jgi:hypothetical protein